jgi:hypothetical protein
MERTSYPIDKAHGPKSDFDRLIQEVFNMFYRITTITSTIALALSIAFSVPQAKAASGQSDASGAKPRSWIADNGNGTYSNPLFYEEF